MNYAKQAAKYDAVLDTARMSDLDEEETRWLWNGLMPRGAITALVGDPGVGKSTLTCRLAASVTRGEPLPLGRVPDRTGSVLIFSAEDKRESTIKRRLREAGADQDRVEVVSAVDEGGIPGQFDLSKKRDQILLGAALQRLEPDLLVFDPLSSYMGSLNTFRDSSVRTALSVVAQMAARFDVAVLTLHHMTKGGAAKILYRALGSIAFVAASRSVLLMGQAPDDDSRGAIIQIKSNLDIKRPAIAYQLDDGALELGGLSDLSAEDVAASSNARPSPKLEKAMKLLLEELQDGPVPAKKIVRMAKARDISERTLRRARKVLGVESIKNEFQGPSLLELP